MVRPPATRFEELGILDPMDQSDDTPMPIDAHFHADALFAVAPGFVDEYRELGVSRITSYNVCYTKLLR